VHNPGSIPDDDRIFSGADLIVVFEDSYADYTLGANSQRLQVDLHNLPSKNINGYARQNYAYMFNAIPSNWSKEQVREFVDSVKDGAERIFLTDLHLDHENIYGRFGNNWEEFLGVL